jgi:chloramphenicol 3-O phosphotransferase
MVSGGTILLLNGTSSAGKSSIARALQVQLEIPALHVGIDHFLSMLPGAYVGEGPPFTPQVLDGFRWVQPPANAAARGIAIRAGPFGQQLIAGFHRAVAALAATGLNLIVDEVLLEPHWLLDWLAVLAGYPTLFVGVYCPLVETERRERARGDQTVGQARAQFSVVHAHGAYDVEVDTAQQSPAACARQIVQALPAAYDLGGNAFTRLRERGSGSWP